MSSWVWCAFTEISVEAGKDNEYQYLCSAQRTPEQITFDHNDGGRASFARQASATAVLMKLTLSLRCVGSAALTAAPGAPALIVRRHERCIYVWDCCSRRLGDWSVSFIRDNLAYTV